MDTPPEPTPNPDVEAIARAVPGWERLPLTIVPVADPAGGNHFRVEAEGEAFVLHLPPVGTASVGAGRDVGDEASRLAQAAGAGPPVHAYLEDRGCLVTRVVPGERIPQADFVREGVLAAIVGSVRAIHACPPIASTFSVFRVVDEYRRLTQERRIAVPAILDDACARARRIESSLGPHAEPAAVCHNDLGNANVLLDAGHAWIVNYEYAGMGDPFFDLGTLCVDHRLPPATQDLLLRQYFGTVSDSHRARLRLMRFLAGYRRAMERLARDGASAEPDLAQMREELHDDGLDRLLLQAKGRV